MLSGKRCEFSSSQFNEIPPQRVVFTHVVPFLVSCTPRRDWLDNETPTLKIAVCVDGGFVFLRGDSILAVCRTNNYTLFLEVQQGCTKRRRRSGCHEPWTDGFKYLFSGALNAVPQGFLNQRRDRGLRIFTGNKRGYRRRDICHCAARWQLGCFWAQKTRESGFLDALFSLATVPTHLCCFRRNRCPLLWRKRFRSCGAAHGSSLLRPRA